MPPRTVPIRLKNGQRASAEVPTEMTDQQFGALLQEYGASYDHVALVKQGILAALPPSLRTGIGLFIPDSHEQILGDIAMLISGLKGAKLAAQTSLPLSRRLGARLMGPAAGATTTAAAGQLPFGSPDTWKDALGMLAFGSAFEGGMSVGRVMRRNVVSSQLWQDSKATAERAGLAVQRWFPNQGTEAEMHTLFREGLADRLASKHMEAMEAEIMAKVGGPKTQLVMPSLTDVNSVLGAKPIKMVEMPGVGNLVNFEDAWAGLKKMRALRRSALEQSEPLKYQEVLEATAALEQDLRAAFRSGAPDALATFAAHQRYGRQTDAIITAMKTTEIFQTAPRQQGALMDLHAFHERVSKAVQSGTKDPLMQELVEAGVGDFAWGLMPPGTRPGAADIIHSGRGILARMRPGEGTTAGGVIPFPETRRLASHPRTPIADVLRPLGTTTAGTLGANVSRETTIPSTFVGP